MAKKVELQFIMVTYLPDWVLVSSRASTQHNQNSLREGGGSLKDGWAHVTAAFSRLSEGNCLHLPAPLHLHLHLHLHLLWSDGNCEGESATVSSRFLAESYFSRQQPETSRLENVRTAVSSWKHWWRCSPVWDDIISQKPSLCPVCTNPNRMGCDMRTIRGQRSVFDGLIWETVWSCSRVTRTNTS